MAVAERLLPTVKRSGVPNASKAYESSKGKQMICERVLLLSFLLAACDARKPCVIQTKVKTVNCHQVTTDIVWGTRGVQCAALLETGHVIKTGLVVVGQKIGLDERGNHVCR